MLLMILLLSMYLVIRLSILWKETVNPNHIDKNKDEIRNTQIFQQIGHEQLNTNKIQEHKNNGSNKIERNESPIDETEQNNNMEEIDINQLDMGGIEASETELKMIKQKIQNFVKENHISVKDYTKEWIEVWYKTPETEAFVLNYPLKKETYSKTPLFESLNKEELPLFLQWDERWGYYPYGSSVIGITGCGPTCLSMVAVHLLQNPTLTPIYMADYAERNGYYVQGTGTSWDFMIRGASELGLTVRELPLNETQIKRHLQNGHPVICIMGKGDFTDTGHFIVLTGLQDGKIKINDPNSRERSEKLWKFEDIKYQIKNLWVYM